MPFFCPAHPAASGFCRLGVLSHKRWLVLQVAVNLNGYTKGARNEIFALWPAPVQTSYMGFPATTGATFLPYLITDKVSTHNCPQTLCTATRQRLVPG